EGGWFRSDWFYYPLAGFIGAIIGSITGEILLLVSGFDSIYPFGTNAEIRLAILTLAYACICGACTAAALASVSLFVVGATQRAVKYALVGLAIGGVLGPVGIFGGGLVTNLFMGEPSNLFGVIVWRGLVWTVYGAGIGFAAGIPSRVPKVMGIGALGGAVGGLAAGVLFDPLSLLTMSITGEAPILSRVIGTLLFSCCTALFIVSVVQLVRQAWVRILAGPLKGKQFILYKDHTTIGCQYESDIFISKDQLIQSLHATISRGPTGYELEAHAPCHVNGHLVTGRKRLAPNDQLQLGETVIEYRTKRI
ncbi:MAG: FHA domain-containing protein, partial [Phycisphaerales bacterium]|nr:FHA domain-containing protein [Phycisphaerales bacterium]